MYQNIEEELETKSKSLRFNSIKESIKSKQKVSARVKFSIFKQLDLRKNLQVKDEIKARRKINSIKHDFNGLKRRQNNLLRTKDAKKRVFLEKKFKSILKEIENSCNALLPMETIIIEQTQPRMLTRDERTEYRRGKAEQKIANKKLGLQEITKEEKKLIQRNALLINNFNTKPSH